MPPYASRLTSSGLTTFALVGGTIVASVAGNALTVSLKNANGNDPSSTDPIYIALPASYGSFSQYTGAAITAPVSVTLSAGSTAGTINNKPFRLWVLLAYNPSGGTYQLALVNFDTTDDNVHVPSLAAASETLALNIAADDGSGIADSTCTFYSNVAIGQTFSYRFIGALEWVSGLAAAGNWSTAPVVTLYRNGNPLPGQIVSSTFFPLVRNIAIANLIPDDDTIPQSSEGYPVIFIDYAPTNPINYLVIEAKVMCTRSLASNVTIAAFLAGQTSAFATAWQYVPAADARVCLSLDARVQIGGDYAVINHFGTLRVGGDIAGNTYINKLSTGRLFGGTLTSGVRVTEIMT